MVTVMNAFERKDVPSHVVCTPRVIHTSVNATMVTKETDTLAHQLPHLHHHHRRLRHHHPHPPRCVTVTLHKFVLETASVATQLLIKDPKRVIS